MLSLPRELRMQTIQHVVCASASQLEDLTSFEREDDEYGTVILRTLGSEPLHRIQKTLRECPDGLRHRRLQIDTCSLRHCGGRTTIDRRAALQPDADIDGSGCQPHKRSACLVPRVAVFQDE